MAYGLPLSGIIALFCLHWLDVVKLNPFPHLRNLRSFSLGLALIFACSVAGANDLPDLGESARADLSPQLERRIGESIMKEIRQREPSYIDDPDINDYLSQLGRRLVEASANPITFMAGRKAWPIPLAFEEADDRTPDARQVGS